MRKIQRQEEMRKVREEIERQQEEDYRNKEADQGWYFWFPIQNLEHFSRIPHLYCRTSSVTVHKIVMFLKEMLL